MSRMFLSSPRNLLCALIMSGAVLATTAAPGTAKPITAPDSGHISTPGGGSSSPPCEPAGYGFTNADCSCDVIVSNNGGWFYPTYYLDCNHNGVADVAEPPKPNFDPPTVSATPPAGTQTVGPTVVSEPQSRALFGL